MMDSPHHPPSNSLGETFLAVGGAMGERMRAHDWSDSAIGSLHDWPQSLRTAISLMMASRFPMFMAWGERQTFFYNDAYAPILGDKHPGALGRPFAEVWSEIWKDLKPMVDQALAGDAVYLENLHLVMERHGYKEDTWYTFSYSPVTDESGRVAGMFCACQETTKQVLLEREREVQSKKLALMFEQTPSFIALLTGPDHVYEFVNEAYVKISGRPVPVGSTFKQCFPEIADQGYFDPLDEVYRTGKQFVARAMPITLTPPPGELRKPCIWTSSISRSSTTLAG